MKILIMDIDLNHKYNSLLKKIIKCRLFFSISENIKKDIIEINIPKIKLYQFQIVSK